MTLTPIAKLKTSYLATLQCVRRKQVLAVLLIGPLGVPPSSAHAAGTAMVVRILGTPMVTHAGTTTELQVGGSVEVGDTIATDDHSKLKLLLADDSVLDIGNQSKITLDAFALKPEGRTAKLSVAIGRFKLAVSKYFGGNTNYEVHTPTAVAGVRGTVLWGDTELDTICSLDGSVEVRATKSSGQTTRLPAGVCIGQLAQGNAPPRKPGAEEVTKYLKAVTIE